MSKTKITLIVLGCIILTLLCNYLFAKKFIQPKIVEDAVKQIQKNIDENYSTKMEEVNSKINVVDGKIGIVEKKRAQVAKDVADLKKKRDEYKPPTTLEDAVKALKGRGYEVIIK